MAMGRAAPLPLLLLAALLLLAQFLRGADAIFGVPTAEIDLTAAPATRWTGALKAVLSAADFDASFGAVFSAHNATLFERLPAEVFDVCAAAVRRFYPVYAAELDGLSAAFADAAGRAVSFEYLAAWVYFHELAHAANYSSELQMRECTGVLATDAAGHVVHGRNMDQEPDAIRHLVLHLVFTQGAGRVVYEAYDWYWFNVGFVTGFRRGFLALEENWRSVAVDLDTMLRSIAAGVLPQVWVFRELLGNSSIATFADAVSYLNSVPTAAPMYNIVSGRGPRDGAIITRDVDTTFAPILLSASASWFLVQTNYDHWLPDPHGDPRRTHAEAALVSLGQELGSALPSVLGVMCTIGVQDSDTAIVAVFDAAHGAAYGYGQNNAPALGRPHLARS